MQARAEHVEKEMRKLYATDPIAIDFEQEGVYQKALADLYSAEVPENFERDYFGARAVVPHCFG